MSFEGEIHVLFVVYDFIIDLIVFVAGHVFKRQFSLSSVTAGNYAQLGGGKEQVFRFSS